MIKFVNAKEVTKLEDKYDKIWYITGTMKKAPSEKFRHVPELSPDKSRAIDRHNNRQVYDITFLREMRQEASMRKLNELYALGKTKNVLCVCYKTDNAHKNLVCGLLQGAYKARGEAYVVDEEIDYSGFYETYNQLKEMDVKQQEQLAIA